MSRELTPLERANNVERYITEILEKLQFEDGLAVCFGIRSFLRHTVGEKAGVRQTPLEIKHAE